MRLRLTIRYDGRDFHGWAAQPESMGLRTVQGEMQRVLSHLFHELVEIPCAGRTDAGVRARGQVAHMDVSAWADDVDVRRINRAVPDDVRVTDIQRVPSNFDARFGAIWRRYTSRVNDDPCDPDPLNRGQILPHHKAVRPCAARGRCRTRCPRSACAGPAAAARAAFTTPAVSPRSCASGSSARP